MKKIIRTFVIAAAAATALISCQKEIENPVQNVDGKYVYSYDLVDGDAGLLKTIFTDGVISWSDNDKVGVFVADVNNAECVVSGSSFSVESESEITAGTSLYAYIPFNKENSSAANVIFTIPDTQTPDVLSMPACGTSVVASAATKVTPKVGMKNLGSILSFKVYSPTGLYTAEEIRSISVTSSDDSPALCGDFTYDITGTIADEDFSISELTGKTVTVNFSDVVNPGTSANLTASVVVAPGAYAGNVVVKTNKATYTFPFDLKAKPFLRSHDRGLQLNLEKNGVREALSGYCKVTSLDEITDGDYVIVASTSNANYALPANPSVSSGSIKVENTISIIP